MCQCTTACFGAIPLALEQSLTFTLLLQLSLLGPSAYWQAIEPSGPFRRDDTSTLTISYVFGSFVIMITISLARTENHSDPLPEKQRDDHTESLRTRLFLREQRYEKRSQKWPKCIRKQNFAYVHFHSNPTSWQKL